MNALLALGSRDASGLLVAAVAFAIGIALRGLGAPLVLVVLVAAIGVALTLASLAHLVKFAAARRALPPPGKLVDLGGYRVHVLAEGEAREGRPPVVWFAGGHASGYAIHHLHRAFRGETRSILIDRPGTGWSDVGPFPRSTAREAEEMVRALERAGEKGPFVWAGHSFGGLLAANIARRRPDLVHTLVLLDPTPLETIVFGPRLEALKDMRRTAWLGGFAQLFGIDLGARHEAKMRATPAYARVLDATRAVLGPEVAAARAIEKRSGAYFTQASIYRELKPEGVAACAWETVVYDRDLGDLPVWLVGPKSDGDADIALLPEAQSGGADNARRMFRFFAATRERYLAASTRSRRIVAPPGSGHNFVYELPDFTIGVMREAILGPAHDAASPAADAPTHEAEPHAA
jgi:pimeloyl-ACP methyl ester carboxylesterase